MSVMGHTFAPGNPRLFDPIEAADLRRRHKRETVEAMSARAEHLAPRDKELLWSVYRDGRSTKEIALLLGVRTRVVRKRLHRLVARVSAPEFSYVIEHIDQWSPTRRAIARATYLQGHALRDAAKLLNLSLHTVRRHHHAIRILSEQSR